MDEHPNPETPRWRLLSLPPLPLEAVAGLVGDLPIDVVAPTIATRADLIEAIADAELLLGDWRTAAPGLDADLVRAAPHLAFVQQPSVGVQAHDGDALAAAGVALSNVAAFNAASVAEWAIGALLALARLMPWAQDEVRAGRWPQTEVVQRGAVEIAGRRVGLVGFGAIGQAMAVRLAAFGCPVSYWSRRQRPPEQEGPATYVADLAELVAGSDVLVNAVAFTPSSRGLLGRDLLERLPSGALLVNASRGGIVDEDAVAALVEGGRIAGAAFDVYATEPLPADSPLLRLPPERVLLTPHIAGSTAQAITRLLQRTVANLGRAVAGEPVEDVVNGVDPVIRRR
ncbi:MAG: D-3-phosphoglycerate dehydrogenase / 2-oxoglutarate reductase [Frankiaceae bacterium]|nr:D-3-phosphoglycerate dehydrogenase / 2-oxoglutarate reductase [Frankiaceae bacterium]